MKSISGIVRIILGLLLIILAYTKYSTNSELVAAGEPIQIFGNVLDASTGQLALAFGLIGLVGLFLTGLGIVTLLKSSRQS